MIFFLKLKHKPIVKCLQPYKHELQKNKIQQVKQQAKRNI